MLNSCGIGHAVSQTQTNMHLKPYVLSVVTVFLSTPHIQMGLSDDHC